MNAKTLTKGVETRRVVLRQALDLTSEVGLEGLSLGVLAKRVGMSKSGLYAHSDSKEGLQRDVLDTAAERFAEVVLMPAFREPRGLPRLERLFELWLTWGTRELSGGCPFIAAAAEFDDRPGTVQDRLVHHLKDLLGAISRSAEIAVEEGHFRSGLDLDQFAYEFWALIVAHQHFSRLLGAPNAEMRARKAFAGLLEGAQGERSEPTP